MLMKLLDFLLVSAGSIFGLILLLRAWLYVWAFSPRHPVVMVTRRASDWLIEPLSKFLRPQGPVDVASLFCAFLCAILTVAAHVLFSHGHVTALALVVAPVAMLVRWALELVGWLAFLWVLMSWLNPQSPMTYALGTLLDPLLRPLRRLPLTIGRFDFSPVLLFFVANLLQGLVMPFSMASVLF
mgnify:CR=1 FL=1